MIVREKSVIYIKFFKQLGWSEVFLFCIFLMSSDDLHINILMFSNQLTGNQMPERGSTVLTH